MRLFIAVDLPPEIRQNLSRLIGRLKKEAGSVKWVAEENIHLTLKFLGEVKENKLAEVAPLVEKAVGGSGEFAVRFAGVERFPGVIFVGTAEGGEELKNLARNLEKCFTGAGWPAEKREFSPHATIGRIKGDDKLKIKLEELNKLEFGGWVVRSVSIIKSTLTPKGPTYENIKEVNL